MKLDRRAGKRIRVLNYFSVRFWRSRIIQSLVGYPEKTDWLEQRRRRGNPGRSFLFCEPMLKHKRSATELPYLGSSQGIN